MEEAQTRMQAKKENAKETKAQIDELLSWAECFEKADIGTKHLIVARLVERVDVSTGYKVHIKFRIAHLGNSCQYAVFIHSVFSLSITLHKLVEMPRKYTFVHAVDVGTVKTAL